MSGTGHSAGLWADSANPVLARFREKQARFGGRCGMCTYRDLCGGGCRVRAHAVEGDFLAEDPFCFVAGGSDTGPEGKISPIRAPFLPS